MIKSTTNSLRALHQNPMFWAVVAGVASGLFVLFPITDGDIFWHLAAGKEIIARQSFLFADTFSYTPVLKNWIDLHWFFQATMYLVDSKFGYAGMLVCKSLAIGLSAFLLVKRFATSQSASAIATVVIVLFFIGRYQIPMRPIVYTILSLVLFIVIIERYFKDLKISYLFLLLPIQLVWVNSQGLFMMGPMVVIGYFGGNLLFSSYETVIKRKKMSGGFKTASFHCLIIVSCLVVVSCVNPYGYHALELAVRLFRRIDPSLANVYAYNIEENFPLLYTIGTVYGHFFYSSLALILVAGVVSIIKPTAQKISRLSLALLFFIPALFAQRNVILFFIASVPALVSGIDLLVVVINRYSVFRKLYLKLSLQAVLILICVGLCAIQSYTAVTYFPKEMIAPFSHPIESAAYLKKYPIRGNMFNADRFGGYLIRELYPDKKVYIDTRLVLRTRDAFAEYLQLLDSPELFSNVQKKYTITQVVIPGATVPRYEKLFSFLNRSKEWRLVLVSGTECLFVIDSLALTSAVNFSDQTELEKRIIDINMRFKRKPKLKEDAFEYLVKSMIIMGDFDPALILLSREKVASGHLLKAEALRKKGDLPDAIKSLEDYLEKNKNDTNARFALAKLLIEQKKFGQAVENIILILKKDPFNRNAREFIASLEQS